jgi:UDP-glucose 4-epimerase
MNQIVITGASGFVGRFLAKKFHAMGYKVLALDLVDPKIAGTSFEYFDVATGVGQENLNIQSGSTFVHLAAISTDSQSRANPISCMNVNIIGTSRVIELANSTSAKRIIFASSEWVYPESEQSIEHIETQPLQLENLNSLYAMTKLFGENAIRIASKVPFTILRFGIVYGPRTQPGSAPESIIYKVSQNEDVRIGNANTARRFIYVDDLVDGICLTASESNLQTSGVFNLSGVELVSLRQIFEISKKITGNTVLLSEGGSEASIRNPNPELFMKEYGYSPTTSLELGLKKCLDVMSKRAIE